MTDLELKNALRQRLADMAAGACGQWPVEVGIHMGLNRSKWTWAVRLAFRQPDFTTAGIENVDAAVDWLWERGVRA